MPPRAPSTTTARCGHTTDTRSRVPPRSRMTGASASCTSGRLQLRLRGTWSGVWHGRRAPPETHGPPCVWRWLMMPRGIRPTDPSVLVKGGWCSFWNGSTRAESGATGTELWCACEQVCTWLLLLISLPYGTKVWGEHMGTNARTHAHTHTPTHGGPSTAPDAAVVPAGRAPLAT